ncbi:MAG: hypothetical protein LH473_06910 [Chitinophagales bacterium]|nr:hypothetical protein [Chitinophagales bacterium]
MKLFIFFFTLLSTICLVSYADTWIQKNDFSGYGRSDAASFIINGKGYVGTGGVPTNETYAKDIWEYEPSTDSWTQKADIPVGRTEAVGFSIGSKGYIGTGQV